MNGHTLQAAGDLTLGNCSRSIFLLSLMPITLEARNAGFFQEKSVVIN
jgi:hypothetical protein